MRIALALLATVGALAQQPNLTNARLETHAVSGSLDTEMRRLLADAQAPQWVAYSVAALPGQHSMCCSNSDRCCSGCSLETRNVANQNTPATPSGPIHLEGSRDIFILLRIENHSIDKIHTYSSECQLDAGGLAVHLLTGVSSAGSLAYLESLAPAHKSAVMAIAMHGDTAADATLDRLAASTQPEKIREDVAFWSGSARGARGVQLLKKMTESDPSERVRDKVMFALSISKDPAALPLLLSSARNDASGKVRSQALFWLAHKAGQKETAAITRAIEEDPDSHVKRQAVFALHELPREEGIPLLIQVARTNKDPQVRKQAMFWLGQTNDPRAVKFFEDVLTK